MTDMKHGCLSADQRPFAHYRRLMDALGCGDVYKVPRRRRGLTSSGEEHACHGNVGRLVRVFGGRQVFGFNSYLDTIYSDKKDTLCLKSHSVWETPEGKWVDVTRQPRDYRSGYTLFTPLNIIESHEPVWWGTKDFYLYGYQKEDFVCCEGDEGYLVDFDDVEDIGVEVFQETLRYQVTHDITDPSVWGGFTLPSLSTGKTFDELLEEKRKEVA